MKISHWLGPSPSGGAPANRVIIISTNLILDFNKVDQPSPLISNLLMERLLQHLLTWGELYTKVLSRNQQERNKRNMIEIP